MRSFFPEPSELPQNDFRAFETTSELHRSFKHPQILFPLRSFNMNKHISSSSAFTLTQLCSLGLAVCNGPGTAGVDALRFEHHVTSFVRFTVQLRDRWKKCVM